MTAGPDHRFRFAIPTGFWPEIRHRIDVRREGDWTLLPGSGLALEPGAGGVGRISEA